MPKFTVDGIAFHSEDLSEEGRRVLETLQFLEQEMRRLNEGIKVTEDAKGALIRTLERTLPRIDEAPSDER